MACPSRTEESGVMDGTGCVFSNAPSEKVDTQMSTAPVIESTVGICTHTKQASQTFEGNSVMDCFLKYLSLPETPNLICQQLTKAGHRTRILPGTLTE
jgi:hypothetical protein